MLLFLTQKINMKTSLTELFCDVKLKKEICRLSRSIQRLLLSIIINPCTCYANLRFKVKEGTNFSCLKCRIA